jgi:hypothetical protein
MSKINLTNDAFIKEDNSAGSLVYGVSRESLISNLSSIFNKKLGVDVNLNADNVNIIFNIINDNNYRDYNYDFFKDYIGDNKYELVLYVSTRDNLFKFVPSDQMTPLIEDARNKFFYIFTDREKSKLKKKKFTGIYFEKLDLNIYVYKNKAGKDILKRIKDRKNKMYGE